MQYENPSNKGRAGWRKIMAGSDITVIIAALLLFAAFSVFSDSFLSAFNLYNISRSAALYIFIALGQAMAIIVGGMNLSLGQIGGLTVVIAGYSMQNFGLHPFIAVVFGLMVGLICGFVNGFIITSLNLAPFVATLATSFVFTGLVNGISEGYPFTDIPKDFTIIGREGMLGVPMLLILSLLALVIVWYIFRYTILGRRLLATGGNKEAARLSAVSTDKMIIIANMASGLFASIAGLLWISRMGAAQPSTGSDWLVISFAVAVIGGTSLQGGAISPLGIVFSAFLIVMVKNGLVMVNANVYYEQSFLGLILLIAVSLESFRSILARRKLKQSLRLADGNKNTTEEQT